MPRARGGAKAASPGSPRRALAALCVTEIVSYGVIYYAFPVLAGQISAGTGWSRTAITAAYSAGNLAGAAAGILAGRLLQRLGPRPVMTAASVLGAASVTAIAAAPTYWWFLAAWLAAGTASAGLYYAPAFAALTTWYGPRRVRALTTLTLAAGFASTIFAPLAAALGGRLGWREAYLVLAALLAVVTIPAHALGLRQPWPKPPAGPARSARRGGGKAAADRRVLGSRAFCQLAAAATLCTFTQYAALVSMVPLLTGRGLSPRLAAWALGLGGVGQVGGRLCYRAVESRTGARGRTAAVIAAAAAVTLLLGLLPGPAALLLGASVAAGAVRGMFTLTQATLVADWWGADRYAVINGVFTAPVAAAGAVAPVAGAGIAAAAGSYPALFAILAAVAAAGAALAGTAPAPAMAVSPDVHSAVVDSNLTELDIRNQTWPDGAARSRAAGSHGRKAAGMHIVAIGGSDAGISAGLRAREVDPGAEVTVIAADAYPNFSICGIPYYVSGEVAHWRDLAHRTHADLEATGMRLRLDTTARKVDVPGRRLHLTGPDGAEGALSYDQLIIGTGALPVVPPVAGLEELGPADGVHLLHSMGDTFAVMQTLRETGAASAAVVGAGYVGLEMAEALTARGLAVTLLERLPEVLPTVDAELGSLVRAGLEGHGVTVHAGADVRRVALTGPGAPGRLLVAAVTAAGERLSVHAGLVLVVAGVRPETSLAASAGATLGPRGAIAVDRAMRTGLPGVYAAGDCVLTHHRLLGQTYLPLGTTAHKQGRVAGENAAGGHREFAGSLGTQVVKVFDQAAARTGLRDHEARAAGYDPVTIAFEADDHKAYYPGSHKIAMRFTGDRATGRLLGVQLFGHRNAEVAKRIDIAATAIYHGMTVDGFSDLDLSYTPPLGSPWDALQLGAQAWTRQQAGDAVPGR